MRHCLLFAAALVVVPAGAAQTLPKATIARIDSIFAPFDRTDRPGCALGVSQQGAVVYTKGYGMSDLQYGLAITPGSIFHVASISKQFAAFAVALLAEDGKLSLDDPVRKHLPEFPDYGKPVTIRQLIYHTSGVRDHWELLGMAGWRYGHDLFTQQDVLDIVFRQRRLNFDPGEEWVYSNGGYTLLAEIVKRISGKSLRQFSDERIFQPVKMTATHVHDDHQMIVPGRTSAYEAGPDGKWQISVPTFDTHGATSLFSTVADLLAWEQNFVTGTVGSRRLLAEAETTSKLNNGKPTNYGFGISIETYRGTPARGHGGADAGYRADVVRFPDHGLAVAALCNFAQAIPSQYTRAVADILVGDRLAPKPAVAAAGTGTKLTEAELGLLAGIYRKPGSDQAWSIVIKEGKPFVENFGAGLDPVDGRRFTAFGIDFEFLGPAGQPAVALKAMNGEQLFDSVARVQPFTPTREQLARLAGRFYSDELDIAYTITLADSGLVITRPKGEGPAPLRPAYQDAFLTPGGVIRFAMVKGRPDTFYLTGGRVRAVEFNRGDPRRPKP
ncbi:MAG: serine hydrolase domain-containing protein [Gemmatimonadales bacterium]